MVAEGEREGGDRGYRYIPEGRKNQNLSEAGYGSLVAEATLPPNRFCSKAGEVFYSCSTRRKHARHVTPLKRAAHLHRRLKPPS